VGLDGVGGFVDGAQFGAEGFDVGVDGAIEAGGGFLPGGVHELVAREDAAGLGEQGFEQAKFVAGEVERMASVGDQAAGVVEGEGRGAGRDLRFEIWNLRRRGDGRWLGDLGCR